MTAKELYRVGAYCRLSHEDGDRVESDSIVNQQRAIEDFCKARPGLEIAAVYADGCVIIGLSRENPCGIRV